MIKLNWCFLLKHKTEMQMENCMHNVLLSLGFFRLMLSFVFGSYQLLKFALNNVFLLYCL